MYADSLELDPTRHIVERSLVRSVWRVWSNTTSEYRACVLHLPIFVVMMEKSEGGWLVTGQEGIRDPISLPKRAQEQGERGLIR